MTDFSQADMVAKAVEARHERERQIKRIVVAGRLFYNPDETRPKPAAVLGSVADYLEGLAEALGAPFTPEEAEENAELEAAGR